MGVEVVVEAGKQALGEVIFQLVLERFLVALAVVQAKFQKPQPQHQIVQVAVVLER